MSAASLRNHSGRSAALQGNRRRKVDRGRDGDRGGGDLGRLRPGSLRYLAEPDRCPIAQARAPSRRRRRRRRIRRASGRRPAWPSRSDALPSGRPDRGAAREAPTRAYVRGSVACRRRRLGLRGRPAARPVEREPPLHQLTRLGRVRHELDLALARRRQDVQVGPGRGAAERQGDACPGGGDTELAVDPAGRLYFNDLSLANFSVARSDDQGRTFPPATPTGVPDAGVDRQWYATRRRPDRGRLALPRERRGRHRRRPVRQRRRRTTSLVMYRSPAARRCGRDGRARSSGRPNKITQPGSCDEGIMGNDEVSPVATRTGQIVSGHATTLPTAVRHVYVIHDDGSLSKILIARCFPVAFGAPVANVSDPSGLELRRPARREPRRPGASGPAATSRRSRSTAPGTSTRSGSRRRSTGSASGRRRHVADVRVLDERGHDLVDADPGADARSREQRLRLGGGGRRRARRHRLVRHAAHVDPAGGPQACPNGGPDCRCRAWGLYFDADAERPRDAPSRSPRRSSRRSIRSAAAGSRRSSATSAAARRTSASPARPGRSATSSSCGSAARARRRSPTPTRTTSTAT